MSRFKVGDKVVTMVKTPFAPPGTVCEVYRINKGDKHLRVGIKYPKAHAPFQNEEWFEFEHIYNSPLYKALS